MPEFSMKLGRHALLGTMAAVTAAPSLPASAAEGEEINWWVTDPSKVTATAFIAEFEKQNPGTRVKLQLNPYADLENKALVALRSGSLPDLLAPALPRLSGSPRLAHAPA
jgi:ABC-type glycerol-3-phosphate transport system substrate-binding protein